MLKKAEIEKFHMPRWEELPNIDLYLDQVVTFIDKYLYDYLQYENDEKENKIITKTMINNYVKQKIMEPPIKKKYNKTNIAYLFVICILKQVYSINDIDKLIKTVLNDTSVEIAYDKFCESLEKAITSTLIDKKFVLDKAPSSDNNYVLMNVVQTIASKLYIEKVYLEK